MLRKPERTQKEIDLGTRRIILILENECDNIEKKSPFVPLVSGYRKGESLEREKKMSLQKT